VLLAPPLPAAAPPPARADALAAALHPDRLPTPPAVATQLARIAERADCRAAEVVEILAQNPVLCSKVLRATNSCLYAVNREVATLERAVVILGLNALRSLALAISLPSLTDAPTDAHTREYWFGSVGGAILARELAAWLRRPSPEDDLVAGLLRELGAALLQRAFPDAWRALAPNRAGYVPAEVCPAEEDAIGVGHAAVSAELLRLWEFPDNLIDPIRDHHRPPRPGAAGPPDRAELLYFVECLTRLEVIARRPDEMLRVLVLARDRFALPPRALARFLTAVAPKIDEFAALIDVDIGPAPDLAGALVGGMRMLASKSQAHREVLC
jgi:HD-like signal output (HDOD) protein